MESHQNHVIPKQKYIGSRTLKDVKAGKIIRVDEDGFENFSDYWTDPDTPQSPASIQVRQGLNSDDRKTQTEGFLALENESSTTMSPFTPSQDELVNLEVTDKSGIFTAPCRQPADAQSQIVQSTELEVFEKTLTGNVHPDEPYDIAATLDCSKMVTDQRSKMAVWMKGVRAGSVEKIESDETNGLKSSNVVTTSSCKRRVGIGQDPLAEELTKYGNHHSIDKCLDLPIVDSKAILNPVVVLHALSPRCSFVPGATSLSCVSFPLNIKGDIAGTISRPTVGLPSAEVGQTSPEVVIPTRKRLTYGSSVESSESDNSFQGTQKSGTIHSEVKKRASSNFSSAKIRNETQAMSLQGLKVAETGSTESLVSQSCKAMFEEFPVVTRERKSHCPAERKPERITSCHSSSATNVVAPARRSLLVESVKDNRQSEAFSVEAQDTFPKDSEKQIPVEEETEIDSEIDAEANNEATINGECFDLFDEAPLSLAPVFDVVREDDILVSDGKCRNLVSLSSRFREEQGDHSDTDSGNDDADDDDFQMVPLSQVKTIKLGYDVCVKKGMKIAKTKDRSNFAGSVHDKNSPDAVDAVGDQNEVAVGYQAILEKPDGTRSPTMQISDCHANKFSKAKKEEIAKKVCNDKMSSDTARKQGGAMAVDTAKNIVKDRSKAKKGHKRMKESKSSDILRKRRRRKRRESNNCYVSEQDEDLSTEEVNQHVNKTVLSHSVSCDIHAGTEEAEENMLDARLTKENRKSTILLECERSQSKGMREKKEEDRAPGRKANMVKKFVDSDQKSVDSEEYAATNLIDAFKKNKRTKGKNKQIFQQQIVPDMTKKQSKGMHHEQPTALDSVNVKNCVAGIKSKQKDKTIVKEDQSKNSECCMITSGQVNMEVSKASIVSNPRQKSVLENVSSIQPAKTRLGRNLVQRKSALKPTRRSRRHAAAVAKQKSSVSEQSVVAKQTERQMVAFTGDDVPDAPTSDVLSHDSPGKRKLRKSRVFREKSLTTIPSGVENQEMPRINQLNVTKTPKMKLSVASPLHYFDGTVSSKKLRKQKLHKIYPAAGSNGEGMRRSRRTRVMTLDWFRNERIHYERRESGFVVAGIYSPKVEPNVCVPEKFAKKMMLKEKRPEKTRRAEQRNLSIHADLSHSLLSRTKSEIKVVNPQTQEEVYMECVKTLDQSKMVGVSGKAPSDDEPLLLCKPIRQKTFASGTLIIRPLQIKKMQFVQNDTMLFHVIQGKVEVTIHQTNFVVESRDKFFVPVGNSYSIRNLRNEDAELDFTQIKS